MGPCDPSRSSGDNIGVSGLSGSYTDEDIADFCESGSVSVRASYRASYFHGPRYVSDGAMRCLLLMAV